MRIVLVIPNYALREQFGPPTAIPDGVARIAQGLVESGNDVEIIDADAENLTGWETVYHVLNFHPSVVGISCNYSPQHNEMIRLAKAVKEKSNAIVMAGGNHATAVADRLVEEDFIDIVVMGEGEITTNVFIDLCRRLGTNVFSGRKLKGEAAFDLDLLPRPAWNLLPMDKYKRHSVHATRGCPHKCTFCSSHIICPPKTRRFSPKRVVDEMEYVVESYGNKRFWFSDDTFSLYRNYTLELMTEMSRLDVEWSCLTRVDAVNEEVLKAMKKAGCQYVSYGIESGDEEMLYRLRKGINLKRAEEAIKLTKEVGLGCFAFFVVGTPGETWQSVKASYDFVRRVPLDKAAFSILTPYPGAELWNGMEKDGIVNYDTVNWDMLMARMIKDGKTTYSSYVAELASKVCDLTSEEIILACEIGNEIQG